MVQSYIPQERRGGASGGEGRDTTMLPGWVTREEGSRGESSQGTERPGVP